MKLTTPDYYKNFKCIADRCTDTCCAGWDVDVDDEAYRYYKSVKGEFGKRLKSVMVPEEEGGCTFTLNNGRCPFLNDSNLCDLIIELGEDKLCETCDEFPRFKNEYGATIEIGIAPSCKTAGELILSRRGPMCLEVKEDGIPVSHSNELDPVTYFQLRNARQTAFALAGDEYFGAMGNRLMLILCFAKELQVNLDNETDELMKEVTDKYNDDALCEKALLRCKNTAIEKIRHKKDEGDDTFFVKLFRSLLDDFKGMEIINPDWNIYVNETRDVLDRIKDDEFVKLIREFDGYYKERLAEYEQLTYYYIYRYFLDAAYDYNVLVKVKNAVVGYLVLKLTDVCDWLTNGKTLSFERQVDLAHLYSRQFEHSYYNHEVYRGFFNRKRRYSYNNLLAMLEII